MAIIYSYPEPTINVGMRLIGSDTTQTGNPTININLGALAEFILAYFNNSGTPNTHAMFITSTTIGDSYINQTAPTFVGAAQIYSNENHWMTKQLVVDGNLYVQPSADKADIWSKSTSIAGEQYTISTTVSQQYYGIENHYGTEIHDGVVTFNNKVDLGDLTTINVDLVSAYSRVQFYGQLLDSNLGSPGGPTQILSSTGTGVQWIDGLPAGLSYMGVWDAFNNIPFLASGVGNPGEYYIVSADGTTNLDGNNTWEIGDWAIFSSTNVWQEIDNQNIFSGAGTTNTMTKFTGPTSLGDSQSTDDGTNINITPTGQLDLGGSPIEITSAINEINVNSKIDLLNKVNLIGTTECTGPFVDAFVSQGNVGQVLSSTGAGQVQWIDGSAAAGALSGGGTLNYIPKWTPSGTELGNSVIFDDGTDLTAAVANDITFTALNDIVLSGKNDVDIAGEGELTLYNQGSAITDRIRIWTHDTIGYDQHIDLWNNNTGLDIDVNLFDLTSTTDLVLWAGVALKLHTTGAGYLAGANFVFQNASVEFTNPIIDSVGSTGAAGNILKNDGTGKVTWGAPIFTQEAKIYAATATITSAELLNIAAVPKILVPALGANLAIVVQSIAISKPVNVSYDFPANLYAVEESNIGSVKATQASLDYDLANVATLLYVVLPTVSSTSGTQNGLILAGNQNLVMTQDGLNATVGTNDFTVGIYYRKLDLTTMEYLTS